MKYRAPSQTSMGTSNYRYLFNNRQQTITTDSIFELEESDIWNVTSSPEFHKPVPVSRISKKSASSVVVAGERAGLVKVLKEDLSQHRRRETDFDEFEYDDVGKRTIFVCSEVRVLNES
ncbi:hypothetical protein Hanom_Chr07g00595521 [Helianthus anomalus]